MGCLAMFAALPSTNMDSTTVEPAPKAPAPLLWRRPEAASILMDGKAANIAVQLTLTLTEGRFLDPAPKGALSKVKGKFLCPDQ